MKTSIEALFEAMVNSGWATESSGDVESPTGYFARISNSEAEIAEIINVFEGIVETYDRPDNTEIVGHFLVILDSQGFVNIERYSTEWDLVTVFNFTDTVYADWLEK